MGNIRFPAEWENQAAILMAWPHEKSDWCYMLHEVQRCFVNVAMAIAKHNNLIIIAPDTSTAKEQLSSLPASKIRFFDIPTNDTWARDFGPISVVIDGNPALYNFKFNAWGLKFPADLDNRINSQLDRYGTFNVKLLNKLNFVLEGGSIESDGNGILLTTENCLLSENRNGQFSKQQIEEYLIAQFGVGKVLWLKHGYLEGDDTDSHIDTLARLCPNDTILYVACDDIADPHHHDLKLMEEELKSFTRLDGKQFNLVKLPMPRPIFDEEGNRLPATYANFLIANGSVIVPTYNQPDNDAIALDTIGQVFPDREIIGVDCNALIKQHGSLHCVTMQLFDNTVTHFKS